MKLTPTFVNIHQGGGYDGGVYFAFLVLVQIMTFMTYGVLGVFFLCTWVYVLQMENLRRGRINRNEMSHERRLSIRL